MNNALMKYREGARVPQELSPALQKKKMEIISKYGDRVRFLSAFAPNVQITMCEDEKYAILNDSPTLTDINATYGKSTAAMFLVPQLFNISEFCGVKDKFTDDQIQETAQLIASSYPWLKVLEVMTFCKQFKLGKYGQFYGSIDPMVIMKSFREFLKYRAEVYADYEDFLAQQRIEEEMKKPHMTFEEWKAMKEANGEKVTISMSVVEERGRELRAINPIETLVERARNIVTNKYSLSMKSLLDMRRLFKEQNGMTPEEVLEKAERNEL